MQSQVEIQSIKLLPSYLLKTIVESGEKSSFVQLVDKLKDYPIRLMQRPMERLIVLVPIIAHRYGSKAELTTEIIKEAVKVVHQKFSNLSVDDIEEAYRQFVAGELEEHIEKNETFGNEFNIRQLGAILTAYNKRRNKVKALLEKNKTLEMAKRNEESRVAQLRERFEQDFPTIISDAKKKYQDWREVPEYLYESCMKRQMICFSKGEAFEIFEEAKILASSEIEIESVSKLVSIAKLLEKKGLEERAKSIARKITVFRKVLKFDL